MNFRLPLLCPSLSLLVIAACTGGDADQDDLDPVVPPDLVQPVGGGSAPDLSGPMFLVGGAYNFVGLVSAGTASVVDSPLVDADSGSGPAPASGATIDITVGGTNYLASNAETMSMIFQDDLGVDFTAISVFHLDSGSGTDLGTVVHVIVPSAEVVAGATVVFDGDDRIALFAHGDINLPEPDVWGAAASGSITFTSGGSAIGDLVTAQVSGDFGEISWNGSNAGGGGNGGGGTGGTTGALVAGNYQLEFVSLDDVYCDGDMLGQEALFSGLTPNDLGLDGGAVSLALTSTSTAELSGTALLSSFGSSTLVLEASNDGPPDSVFAVVNSNEPGPTGTTAVAAYLLLDTSITPTSYVSAMSGVAFVNASETGSCTTQIKARLLP